MDDERRADLEAIEDLHTIDVAATKTRDINRLESLMDADCVLVPPDGAPVAGREYLSAARASGAGAASAPEILEVVQEWDEVELLGDHAYELGVVRYSVREPSGRVQCERQRILRILRRQADGTWKVLRAMWHEPQVDVQGEDE